MAPSSAPGENLNDGAGNAQASRRIELPPSPSQTMALLRAETAAGAAPTAGHEQLSSSTYPHASTTGLGGDGSGGNSRPPPPNTSPMASPLAVQDGNLGQGPGAGVDGASLQSSRRLGAPPPPPSFVGATAAPNAAATGRHPRIVQRLINSNRPPGSPGPPPKSPTALASHQEHDSSPSKDHRGPGPLYSPRSTYSAQPRTRSGTFHPQYRYGENNLFGDARPDPFVAPRPSSSSSSSYGGGNERRDGNGGGDDDDYSSASSYRQRGAPSLSPWSVVLREQASHAHYRKLAPRAHVQNRFGANFVMATEDQAPPPKAVAPGAEVRAAATTTTRTSSASSSSSASAYYSSSPRRAMQGEDQGNGRGDEAGGKGGSKGASRPEYASSSSSSSRVGSQMGASHIGGFAEWSSSRAPILKGMQASTTPEGRLLEVKKRFAKFFGAGAGGTDRASGGGGGGFRSGDSNHNEHNGDDNHDDYDNNYNDNHENNNHGSSSPPSSYNAFVKAAASPTSLSTHLDPVGAKARAYGQAYGMNRVMAIEDRDDPPNPYKIPTIRTRMGYSQVGYLHDWERNVAASKGKTRAQVDQEMYGGGSGGSGNEGEGSYSKWAWNNSRGAAASPRRESASPSLSAPSSPGGWGDAPNSGRYVPGNYNQHDPSGGYRQRSPLKKDGAASTYTSAPLGGGQGYGRWASSLGSLLSSAGATSGEARSAARLKEIRARVESRNQQMLASSIKGHGIFKDNDDGEGQGGGGGESSSQLDRRQRFTLGADGLPMPLPMPPPVPSSPSNHSALPPGSPIKGSSSFKSNNNNRRWASSLEPGGTTVKAGSGGEWWQSTPCSPATMYAQSYAAKLAASGGAEGASGGNASGGGGGSGGYDNDDDDDDGDGGSGGFNDANDSNNGGGYSDGGAGVPPSPASPSSYSSSRPKPRLLQTRRAAVASEHTPYGQTQKMGMSQGPSAYYGGGDEDTRTSTKKIGTSSLLFGNQPSANRGQAYGAQRVLPTPDQAQPPELTPKLPYRPKMGTSSIENLSFGSVASREAPGVHGPRGSGRMGEASPNHPLTSSVAKIKSPTSPSRSSRSVEPQRGSAPSSNNTSTTRSSSMARPAASNYGTPRPF